jgi:hypothetical protein
MLGWLFGKRPDEFGAPRSSGWHKVRNEWVKAHPECEACGDSRAIEVHHVLPFHDSPQKELDPQNCVSLCADPCHFVFGHLKNWKKSNPHVREDCLAYRQRIRDFG